MPAGSEPAPPTLSASRPFKNVPAGTFAAGVESFTPQYPLWPDGATKRRWVSLPAEAAIHARRAAAWQFPVGTRFWKEFSVDGRRYPIPSESDCRARRPRRARLPARELPPPPAITDAWTIVAGATITAWSGPWGTSFTANLTSDADTGLGRWTFQNFRDTICTGRHMGRGRPVLPPMPIPVYRNFTDEDLEAIFSYLRTIPPIKNRVAEPLPPGETMAAAPEAATAK